MTSSPEPTPPDPTRGQRQQGVESVLLTNKEN